MFLGFGLALSVEGCSMQPREFGQCAFAGAVLGAAVGTAAGLGIAYIATDHGHPDTSTLAAAMGGTGGFGAIAGGLIGHEICDPLVAPPPPPPAPVAAAAPAPPPPPEPVHHEKLVLRGVHFDFNKAKIRPGDASTLDEAAEILNRNPDVNVNVDGYCDAIGSEEYNLKLSQRRADAVANYLEGKGIAASRLTPRGLGKTNFVAPNYTDEGRAQNRRVELNPVD
jgi:outer membrane protein OmpA-like peptidoglycan-associated protein